MYIVTKETFYGIHPLRPGGQSSRIIRTMHTTIRYFAFLILCVGLIRPLSARGHDPNWQGPRPATPSQPQVLEIPPQPQPAIPRGYQAPARQRQPQSWYGDRRQADDRLLTRQRHEHWCSEQRARLAEAMNDQALRQQDRLHRLDEQERQAEREHFAFHALFGGVPAARCLWEELHIRRIVE